MRARVRKIKAKRKLIAAEAAMNNAEDIQNYVRGYLIKYGLEKPEPTPTPAPTPIRTGQGSPTATMRTYRDGKPTSGIIDSGGKVDY